MIRVWPEDGSIQPLVDGLQLPTGLAFTPGGGLLVLELCRALLQPLDAQWQGEAHGGFERFSGRLLHCDLASGTVRVLATGLDTPSNLCLLDDAVLVSEGMGLHGRPCPFPAAGRCRWMGGYGGCRYRAISRGGSPVAVGLLPRGIFVM